MAPTEDPLDRLHRDLGLKRLNPLWAKLEIFFGLFVAALALLAGVALVVRSPVPDESWLVSASLVMLGGYLALAGHRSHLYQSNNRLAAHLADLIRSQQPPQPEKPS